MTQLCETDIAYKSGYRYQLARSCNVILPFTPASDIYTEFIKFNVHGVMQLKTGYAWDGPSGPAIDTKNFMRGSLVHDALYQLIGENLLPEEPYRKLADEALREICILDGMSRLRAWWVYNAVRIFGREFATTGKPIELAP